MRLTLLIAAYLAISAIIASKSPVATAIIAIGVLAYCVTILAKTSTRKAKVALRKPAAARAFKRRAA